MTRKQLMKSLSPLVWCVERGTTHADLNASFVYVLQLRVYYKIRDIQNKEGKYSLFFCLSGRGGELAAVCIATLDNIYELKSIAETHRLYLLCSMLNFED